MAKKKTAAVEGEVTETAGDLADEAIAKAEAGVNEDAQTSDDEVVITQPAETTEIPEEGPDVKEDAPAEEVSEETVVPSGVEVVSTIEGNIRTLDGSKIGKGDIGYLSEEDAKVREEAGQVKIVG